MPAPHSHLSDISAELVSRIHTHSEKQKVDSCSSCSLWLGIENTGHHGLLFGCCVVTASLGQPKCNSILPFLMIKQTQRGKITVPRQCVSVFQFCDRLSKRKILKGHNTLTHGCRGNSSQWLTVSVSGAWRHKAHS